MTVVVENAFVLLHRKCFLLFKPFNLEHHLGHRFIDAAPEVGLLHHGGIPDPVDLYDHQSHKGEGHGDDGEYDDPAVHKDKGI